MYRATLLLLASGLAATSIGCRGAVDASGPTSQSESNTSADSEFTLVTLKVPGMT